MAIFQRAVLQCASTRGTRSFPLQLGHAPSDTGGITLKYELPLDTDSIYSRPGML